MWQASSFDAFFSFVEPIVSGIVEVFIEQVEMEYNANSHFFEMCVDRYNPTPTVYELLPNTTIKNFNQEMFLPQTNEFHLYFFHTLTHTYTNDKKNANAYRTWQHVQQVQKRISS